MPGETVNNCIFRPASKLFRTELGNLSYKKARKRRKSIISWLLQVFGKAPRQFGLFSLEAVNPRQRAFFPHLGSRGQLAVSYLD